MIEEFQNEYRWLSNFTEVTVKFEGEEYPSIEHAYVAAKTTDEAIRKEIQALPTAAKAKTFGKTLPIRKDWDTIKLGIMRELSRQKYSVPKFAQLLLDTGNQEIVEGNKWHDTFWGRCNCITHKGKGENNLGKILMQIRDKLNQPTFFS